MDFFQWNKSFETDIPLIDEKHRYLVDTINQFANLLLQNKTTIKEINTLIEELIQYAKLHFQDEESLMSDLDIDLRHTNAHKTKHKQFLLEVTLMKSGITKKDKTTSNSLLKFLSAWLIHHILELDQNLSGQIKAIKSGISPKTAYEEEEKKKHVATDPLLVALNQLFEHISNQNRKLEALNRNLEAKVIKRTNDLLEANMKLEKLSLTDPLTNLSNRRHAMESLKQMWKKSIDSNTQLSCMMIDADEFKQVNDTHGHDIGDQVLIELSKQLQDRLRNDDIICRLGGDEFFVICPKTPQKGALHLANLILTAVNALKIPTGNSHWKGSISIGVASRSTKINTREDLIKAADKGVYAAKAAGKNCIKISNQI
ncbi:MAG: GGDEF domain-containing protein [Desulfobacteraceae bacterium]|nr:GGDEF domain-containing protein [Desulfobacteraceae bacterium]